ncbi:MAG: hypothetical protein ISN29_10435, partial [Gammaproteobacteria bacterium AqS3]|nr:hypothetical protein [Gammaproteobacteria bacterium AqS3]
LVGWIEPGARAVLSALGGRGLAFADLCAELLASQLNDEPWPLSPALASMLAPDRQRGVWDNLSAGHYNAAAPP